MPTNGQILLDFGYKLIKGYLRSRNLKYVQDSDRDFRVVFGGNSGTSLEVALWIEEREKGPIYSICAFPDQRVLKDDWGTVLSLCNTWNNQRHWPRARLYMPENNTVGNIKLDFHVSINNEITPELFAAITDDVVRGAISFWEWYKNSRLSEK